MCDYIDGRCDVWNETIRKARREHKCSECFRPILVGATYMDVRSLYDGRWNTARAHVECVKLRKHIAFDVCRQDLYVLDGDMSLRESVREHYREAPELLGMYRRAMKAACHP